MGPTGSGGSLCSRIIIITAAAAEECLQVLLAGCWLESNKKKANVSEQEAEEEAKESGLRILMRNRGGAAPQ